MFAISVCQSLRANVFLLGLLGWVTVANAAEPSTTPILRIDPGMHTAMIRHIATDAQGRYLVTASDDKTARVWDIATGKLLSTLRPPQGADNEGKLFAVALSPDGNTVAVGGWTGQDWEGKVSIYLFDRASGRMLHRLDGLPNVILKLAFSPDGRYLAASLFGKNGIRVYRTDTWQEAGRDAEYGSDSYGASFSADNRLVASSYDGQLRLYQVSGSGLNLIARAAAPGGKQPFTVRFSPDGRKIAVGFVDTTAVNVLDGNNLNPHYAPDTSMVKNGNLGRVAWSTDGRFLYAGGTFGQNGNPILRWPQAGQGKPELLTSGANDVLMDFAALKDGSLLFGSGDPAWGRLDRNGRQISLTRGPIADYRNNPEGFTLSRDGLTVGFGFEVFGKSPASFSLAGGLKLEKDNGLSSHLIEAPGLVIRDWKNTTLPTLNGQALKLDQYERSHSLAIAPSGRHFALGAAWSVRYFDAGGKEAWKVPAPGTAWAVNVSGDGRYVVAALSDGTLRWYDARDGKEKLAFFPHADKQRWVAWTPSGYYSASPGGEDLIGWHVNNGKDAAADFYPVSRFRAKFYRPDVLAKVLTADSESEALQLANQEAGRKNQTVEIQNILPPVIRITSPADVVEASSNQVTVRYTVRSPSDAPVTGIHVRINGQAVNEARALVRQQSGDTSEITVTIPSQDSEIKLFAENRNGISTPSNALRVVWKGKPDKVAGSSLPKLYVLAAGVSQYDIPEYKLGFAAKDAVDFVKVMQQQKGKLYRDVEVKLLTDHEANRDNILDGLDWLRKNVTSNDVGVLFLSGHGMNDADGTYYYVPSNGDGDKIKRTGVVFTEIKNTMAHMEGRALFFIDSCHAGNVLGGRKSALMDANAVVNELSSEENGVVVFSSSTRNQLSQESAKWNNGAFTKALVEGLNGSADFKKSGRVTYKFLDAYLGDRVHELTSGQQTPITQAPGGVPDFPVAVVR